MEKPELYYRWPGSDCYHLMPEHAYSVCSSSRPLCFQVVQIQQWYLNDKLGCEILYPSKVVVTWPILDENGIVVEFNPATYSYDWVPSS